MAIINIPTSNELEKAGEQLGNSLLTQVENAAPTTAALTLKSLLDVLRNYNVRIDISVVDKGA